MQKYSGIRGRRITNSSAGLAAFLFAITGALGPGLHGQDVSQRALDNAHNFLKTKDRGNDILGFLHFGTDYHGHEFRQALATGRGNFALVYRFHWSDDDITDAEFLCDSRGDINDIRIMSTSAVINRPFFLADAAVQILGNFLIDAAKDKLSPAERKIIQKFVDNADAKGMLIWWLRFQRVWGG
ncbi:MAG: hypothetical protein JO307_30255 [Bryobacterales bacterium]|nr:hypothetical protein [Bryobacterales bacterium]MBV9400420.1 hypothetical protein [Bryobacterales bacterium]